MKKFDGLAELEYLLWWEVNIGGRDYSETSTHDWDDYIPGIGFAIAGIRNLI